MKNDKSLFDLGSWILDFGYTYVVRRAGIRCREKLYSYLETDIQSERPKPDKIWLK